MVAAEDEGNLELGRGGSGASLRSIGSRRQSLLAERQQSRKQSLRFAGGPKFRTCYFIYCIVCLVLTSALLGVAAWEAFDPSEDTKLWRRRLKPWEEVVEVVVGVALFAEVFVNVRMLGWRRYLQTKWRLLDAAVAALTLLCGVVFFLRRLAGATDLGEFLDSVYVPVLALRFAIQPFRFISTASMVVRASRLRKVASAEHEPEPVQLVDPRKPCEGLKRNVLSVELAVILQELLPAYLRFDEWELGYAPGVHGTSLTTFYRQQAGANLIAIEDAHGGIFGCFVLGSWYQAPGSYGQVGAFVWRVREAVETTSGSEMAEPAATGPEDKEPDLDVFWARPSGLLQWGNGQMFGVGNALSVQEDFLHGHTRNCETFGSGPLAHGGSDEFVIRSFECWHIGSG